MIYLIYSWKREEDDDYDNDNDNEAHDGLASRGKSDLYWGLSSSCKRA